MRTDICLLSQLVIARSEATTQSRPVVRKDSGLLRFARNDDYFLSRKYGSTGPCTLIVNGLPWRSLALPAVTRTQPSLTQYSSTLVFSTPLKRMPTSRERISAL